jgi:hypothetical protein
VLTPAQRNALAAHLGKLHEMHEMPH